MLCFSNPNHADVSQLMLTEVSLSVISQNIEQGKKYKVVLHVKSVESVNVSVSLTSSDGVQNLATANVMWVNFSHIFVWLNFFFSANKVWFLQCVWDDHLFLSLGPSYDQSKPPHTLLAIHPTPHALNMWIGPSPNLKLVRLYLLARIWATLRPKNSTSHDQLLPSSCRGSHRKMFPLLPCLLCFHVSPTCQDLPCFRTIWPFLNKP